MVIYFRPIIPHLRSPGSRMQKSNRIVFWIYEDWKSIRNLADYEIMSPELLQTAPLVFKDRDPSMAATELIVTEVKPQLITNIVATSFHLRCLSA